MSCIRYVVLGFLLSVLIPRAAHADTSQEAQIWTAVLGTAKPQGNDGKLRLWLDMHLRRTSGGFLHIARPAVGWALSDKLSLWAGYAWVPVVPDEGDTVHEHRAWQQVVLNHKAGAWSLQSRTRFEQRLSGGGDDIGFRVREFVRANWQSTPNARHGLALWDEAFIGLNETDWGAPSGLDQNRFFAGPFFKVGDRMRLEMGYLLLYLNRGNTDTVGHVLATNLFYTL